MTGGHAVSFTHALSFDDLSDDLVAFARRCTLDLLGVAASAIDTELSKVIRRHAAAHFGAGDGPSATILFDGRIVSPAGAALAGAMTIDAIDAHDGHKITKGHSGCSSLPATLALAQAAPAGSQPLGSQPQGSQSADQEFLTSLIIGYEISTRAGIALHDTAPDYHTSGAWGAVACAALGARAMGLDVEATRHALGIAEYHGPRSQMMRVIDHPTMLKDGSGWGAMAGISAAYLAADGFTGAPAITVEAPELDALWSDLGTNWRIYEQYFKPHPVCRWAQPAVEAALQLRRTHGLIGTDVERIEVVTFHEAARLATSAPSTTEQAQYSLPFPVAAAVSRGQLGATEVTGDALVDAEIHRLSASVVITESDAYNAAFPANRFAHVALVTRDGRRLVSEPTEPRGDPEDHLGDAEIRAKYHQLADGPLGVARATEIEAAVDALGAGGGLEDLFALVNAPINVAVS